jgi:prepilin-type N-terminal cleavage/methylation domain-containing protein
MRSPRVPGTSAHRRAGLSLIEVLLALAILLLSLAPIARLVDMGADDVLEAQFQIRASRLAQAKMSEVMSGYTQLSSSSGSFDTDPDWNWTLTAEQQGVPNLYNVSVVVSRDMKGRQFQYTLSQMVFDPTKMGSASPATLSSSSSSDSDNDSSSGGSP